MVEGGSTPYPFPSPSELSSQIHIYDGVALQALKRIVVVEKGSTLYQSPSELCSQILIYDSIDFLELDGVVVFERRSTPYPSHCPSPSPSELCSEIHTFMMV